MIKILLPRDLDSFLRNHTKDSHHLEFIRSNIEQSLITGFSLKAKDFGRKRVYTQAIKGLFAETQEDHKKGKNPFFYLCSGTEGIELLVQRWKFFSKFISLDELIQSNYLNKLEIAELIKNNNSVQVLNSARQTYFRPLANSGNSPKKDDVILVVKPGS